MSENHPPGGSAVAGPNGDVPGQPFYEKTRAHLKNLLNRRRELERSLAMQEEAIYKKETEYLEETPSGNIIIGFEAYTKGTLAPGQRRRAAVQMENRVFSRSSISFNVNAESPMDTAQSTPVAAMAPTPLSTAFLNREVASNQATPTSSANRSAAGGKRNKKGGNGDDSDTDAPSKKVRTNFSAARK